MVPKFHRIDKFVVKVTILSGGERSWVVYMLDRVPKGGVEILVDEDTGDVSLQAEGFVSFATLAEVGINAKIPPS